MRLVGLVSISALLFFLHPGTGRSITRFATGTGDTFPVIRSSPLAQSCNAAFEADAYQLTRQTHGPVLGWESDEVMEEQ